MASVPDNGPAPGVQFVSRDGRRSSQSAGKTVFADAVRSVDPDLAQRIEGSKNWRKDYIESVRAVVAAGATSGKNALRIASDGLHAIHSNLSFVGDDGEVGLRDALRTETSQPYETATIQGEGERPPELSVPYRDRLLRGGELHAQIARWRDAGVLEPSCADALDAVADEPRWLDLSDVTFVILGAASEMGPLEMLCRCGATVVAIDLPRKHLWDHIAAIARRGSGTVHVPSRTSDFDPSTAGVDLLTEGPTVRAWISSFGAPFTIGNYVYADGADFVRIAGLVDALIVDLVERHRDVGIAYLATPTDVFAVPGDVVDATIARRRSGIGAKTLRTISASNLYEPNYATTVSDENGERWGISDALVPIQGANYALAKSLQKWRAMLAREEGLVTSANVAPSTRTRSVTKNRLLAAAYRGAPAFGVEIFEPETSRALTSALLIHDLRSPTSVARPDVPLEHPYELFANGALHGGIWRLPHTARSILPLGLALGMVRR